MEATILQTVDKAVSFRFLGASQGIITFVDRLSAQQEQAKEGSLLQSLFSNLRQWEGRTRAHDKFAWIAIFGLPMEGWNKNCIDTLLQSWGNIVGYDTTCVSQGSISGIRVLINTIKLEPLHDQVILELDGAQVDVILQEIKETKLRILNKEEDFKVNQETFKYQSFNKKISSHQEKEIVKPLNFNSKKTKRRKNHNFKQA
ncbi:hypothetical protein Peur_024721 [Populus x canadensis]